MHGWLSMNNVIQFGGGEINLVLSVSTFHGSF